MNGKIKEVGIDNIESGDWVDHCYSCPVHNTPLKKEYEFARLASVYTYKGCTCASCIIIPSLKKLYFDSYNNASSEARYHVQRLTARYR